MFGVNQAECCSGETAACGPLTAEVTGGPRAALRDAAQIVGARRSRT